MYRPNLGIDFIPDVRNKNSKLREGVCSLYVPSHRNFRNSKLLILSYLSEPCVACGRNVLFSQGLIFAKKLTESCIFFSFLFLFFNSTMLLLPEEQPHISPDISRATHTPKFCGAIGHLAVVNSMEKKCTGERRKKSTEQKTGVIWSRYLTGENAFFCEMSVIAEWVFKSLSLSLWLQH